MSKKAEQNKISSDEHGFSVEHRAIYDDNLLPAADELAKLKTIDPTIVEWVKGRTEKEQDARIEFNHRRMDLAHKELNMSAAITITAIVLCFVVICGIFLLSYKLILGGYNLSGTIFGGIDLGALLLLLFKIRSPKQ